MLCDVFVAKVKSLADKKLLFEYLNLFFACRSRNS